MAIKGEYLDDDDEKPEGQKKFKEWDCPSCNANNPSGDGIEAGEEVICNYCGVEFMVKISEEGKLKLREL